MPYRIRELFEDVAQPLAASVAIACAVAAGAVHLRSGLLRLPGEINVAGALTAAVVCPRAAWRWGAIGIFAIPGAYLVAEALGLETTLPTLARVDAALAFLGPIIVASVVSFLVIRYWPGRGPKSAHPHP